MTLTLWLIPVAYLSLPTWRTKKRPPTYTRATALMKRGNYNQAEWEVIRELEKCENDFDGWLLLAELYAVHFKDLGAAERTVCDMFSQRETNVSQICLPRPSTSFRSGTLKSAKTREQLGKSWR